MYDRMLALAIGTAVLAAPSPALAQNVVADPEIVAAAMEDVSLDARIGHLPNGLPFIESSIGEIPFRVFFLGCTQATDCKWVQFWAAFKGDGSPSLEAMNAYARDNPWGRIYIDEQDDPAIEMDVDLEVGGMSRDLFQDNLAYWAYALGEYAKFVRANQ